MGTGELGVEVFSDVLVSQSDAIPRDVAILLDALCCGNRDMHQKFWPPGS